MSTYSMPWTLTRGEEEVDGQLTFEPIHAERRTRHSPGHRAYIDDVRFLARGEEIELTDMEVDEATDLALDYAQAEVEAMADEAAEWERERRRERRREARLEQAREKVGA